jgi:hypothetical protein
MTNRKRVAILQSNYIPWKGYFDLIGLSDEFILYDEVQYTKNDWRNRNRIKAPQGVQWLTIPVAQSGRFGQRVADVQATDSRWRAKHWKSLVQSYGASPYFAEYESILEQLYLGSEEARLSVINRSFIEALCSILGIATTISWSSDYSGGGDRIERLIGLCRALDAEIYLSGPAARAYLDEGAFARAGIELEYMDYTGYPEYEQPFPPFEHAVSILDLLFSTGPQAAHYLKWGTTRS